MSKHHKSSAPQKSIELVPSQEKMGANVTSIRRDSNEAAHTSSLRAPVEQIVRQRAYEFYEKRGREDGHAIEDWLRAEAEVLSTVSRRARVG
jgi:hypothetical protein